jgi:hypothetical protein
MHNLYRLLDGHKLCSGLSSPGFEFADGVGVPPNFILHVLDFMRSYEGTYPSFLSFQERRFRLDKLWAKQLVDQSVVDICVGRLSLVEKGRAYPVNWLGRYVSVQEI